MKKLLSLGVTLALLCSLLVPAAGAATADERLAAVTAQVKATLALDTESYTEFYGNLEDDLLAPVWYLNWYGEDSNLSISATEAGKVINYYYYSSASSASSSSGQFAPSFPAVSREEARAAALAFLDRVLDENETAIVDDSRGSTASLTATRYRFYGEILVNGLDAGLSFSIAVGCADGAVLSFYRDDLAGMVMGEIPAPEAAVTGQQAAAALRDTLSMKLEYVLPEGSTQAVLRYLPVSGDEYYVDAKTGELVNLSELFRLAATGEFGTLTGGSADKNESASADAAASSDSLTDAEIAGAARLEGVLDRETLDAAARAWTALGLDRYTLSTVNYNVGRENEEDGAAQVTATLIYGKQTGSNSWRRTVSVDAFTGELLSVSSSARLSGSDAERTLDLDQARQAAEEFLLQIAPEQYAPTQLYSCTNALDSDYSVSHSLTYAQQANGYFYAGNYLRVGVDSTDGSISSYYKNYDETVTFDSAQGILSLDEAVDAWLATYEAELQYVLVPAAIDFSQPEYAALADMGYTYLYRAALGYQLEREDYLYGIDAKTGAPVEADGSTQDDSICYDDLTGHWAREKIETLAQYGVGYLGGSFRPDQALTQLDLVALLVSTNGYRYQAEEENGADRLYERAYSLGILTAQERDDSAALTRAQTVKLILDAMGYADVAQLDGIFRTDFTDDGEIPAQYYGYAALAQGLGMVGGTPGSRFLPQRGATRAEAAVMLYNLLDR